jgi:hypothetical protein
MTQCPEFKDCPATLSHPSAPIEKYLESFQKISEHMKGFGKAVAAMNTHMAYLNERIHQITSVSLKWLDTKVMSADIDFTDKSTLHLRGDWAVEALKRIEDFRSGNLSTVQLQGREFRGTQIEKVPEYIPPAVAARRQHRGRIPCVDNSFWEN